jgi:ATP-dependent Lon protease
LKEKLLAAHRNGIKTAILPKDNEKDHPELPEVIRKEMELHFVSDMDEVLTLALEEPIELGTVTPAALEGAEKRPGVM